MTILIWTTYNINQFVIYLNKLFQQKEKPQTRRAHLISYLPLYYHHWVDTSAGGLLVPKGIILPMVSVSAQTWFIRYIFWTVVKAGGLAL
jgi:hypothetical protein